MRFLTVAERELKCGARSSATYRVRWITASCFLLLLIWLVWAFSAMRNRGAASGVFSALGGFAMVYCLLVGATRTADSLSSEKREGTLGLLFLTDMSSAEIVAGKLCSNALSAVYGLFSIFPLLALPLLLGGITFDHFWKTVLSLLNATFLATALGMTASCLTQRQFSAIALSTGLLLLTSLGSVALGEIVDHLNGPAGLRLAMALISPFYAFRTADATVRLYGSNEFWLSLGLVHLTAWGLLAAVSVFVARTWRDTGQRRALPALLRRKREEPKAGATKARPGRAHRTRLLEFSPFLWLASRSRVPGLPFLVLALCLLLVNVHLASPYFASVMGNAAMQPMLGHMFSWLWTGLILHLVVLYLAGSHAARRLAEDRQSGSLELVLSTPLDEPGIFRGLRMAFVRSLYAPMLVTALSHIFFMFHVAALMLMDLRRPGTLVLATSSPGQLLWSALWKPMPPTMTPEWPMQFMARVLVVALLVMICNWMAIGPVGRWFGLRLKHPAFAPFAAIGLVLVPPWIAFGLLCWGMDEAGFMRHEETILPFLLWVALGFGVGHSLLVGGWASDQLRRQFRNVVTGQFQEVTGIRAVLPSRRSLLRLGGLAGALLALAVGTSLVQTWQLGSAWRQFNAELAARGEVLSFEPYIAKPLADERNLAASAFFKSLLNKTPGPLEEHLTRLQGSPVNNHLYNASPQNDGWASQDEWDLHTRLGWLGVPPKTKLDRPQAAARMLETLATAETHLKDFAQLAGSAEGFQATPGRTPQEVRSGEWAVQQVLYRVGLLFGFRACANLATEGASEAAEDVVRMLDLARVSTTSPGVGASQYTQLLLADAIQPVWEGLKTHAWTDPQLAEFQRRLQAFDLLKLYTNSLHRMVQAAIADATAPNSSIPRAAWNLSDQRRWVSFVGPEARIRVWVEMLYRAGRHAAQLVDVAQGTFRVEMSGPNGIHSLSLDELERRLLDQAIWWGASPSLAAFVQNAVNQAIIACALERHFLRHRTYPEALNQLQPELLNPIPKDPLSGRPMTYRRHAPGQFSLRGVGPNQELDEQHPVSDDWIWSAAKAATLVKKPGTTNAPAPPTPPAP